MFEKNYTLIKSYIFSTYSLIKSLSVYNIIIYTLIY